MAAFMVLKLFEGPWGSLVPRVSMRACIDVSTLVEKDNIVGARHTVCCASGTLFKLLDLLNGACKGFGSKKKQAGDLSPSEERRHSEL